jgi:DNA-binding NarL/FixJ family response regulator
MIVSNHPLMSAGLRLVCSRRKDVEIVSEARDLAHVVDDFEAHRPDVTIVDLQLPQAKAVIRQLRELDPAIPVLVLTTSSGQAAALRNGFDKLLTQVSKTSRSETIVDAARSAALGQKK